MPLTGRMSQINASFKHEGEAMAKDADTTGGRRGIPWRLFGWGTAALLLLLPQAAMQFTSEVNWTLGDFIFAGLLIGFVGATFELTVRASRSGAYRGGVAAALEASFLIIWVNGAVGMIGDERNPYNLLFLGVILVALVGAILARFRAAGMAIAMVAAAIAQVGVAAGGLFVDFLGSILSAAFAGLWLLAAALFQIATRQREPT